MKRVCSLVMAGLLVGSAGLAAEPTPAAGDAKVGRETFLKSGCDQCHGREGQGSPTSGPKLGPSPPPLAAFTAFVRRPPQQMPPYGPLILSDGELADIHAYLSSRPPPPANAKLPP